MLGGGSTAIQTYISYGEEIVYNSTESVSVKYSTIGIIGDGTNINFYEDDVLRATRPIKSDLTFDKITIRFNEYPGYGTPSRNYLERLYFGNIKYYKDII